MTLTTKRPQATPTPHTPHIPAANQAPQTQAPAQAPQEAPTPYTQEEVARMSDTDFLLALQRQDRRLSTEELHIFRMRIGTVTDEKTRGDLYEALQLRVPFHNQRNNEALGKSIKTRKGEQISTSADANNMCNLTALAGNLDYLGVNVPTLDDYPNLDQKEDRLEMLGRNRQYGDGKNPKAYDRRAADNSGWKGTAEDLGVNVDYVAGSKLAKTVPEKDWRNWEYWQNTLKEQIRQGRGVMVNLGPQGRGHYVRIVQITDTGVIADDPYGASTLLGNDRGYQTTKDPKTKKERKLINPTDSDNEEQTENPGSRLFWTKEEVGNQNFSEIHVLHAPDSEVQDIQKMKELIETQKNNPTPLTQIPLRRPSE